jgi:hypothetical protein
MSDVVDVYIVRTVAGSWGRSLLTNSPLGKNYLLSPPTFIFFYFGFRVFVFVVYCEPSNIVIWLWDMRLNLSLDGGCGGYFGPRIPWQRFESTRCNGNRIGCFEKLKKRHGTFHVYDSWNTEMCYSFYMKFIIYLPRGIITPCFFPTS